MGHVRLTVRIRNGRNEDRCVTVNAIANSRMSRTVLPSAMAEELGPCPFVFIERDPDYLSVSEFVVADEADDVVLDLPTLTALCLRRDPVTGELSESEPYMLAAH